MKLAALRVVTPLAALSLAAAASGCAAARGTDKPHTCLLHSHDMNGEVIVR